MLASLVGHINTHGLVEKIVYVAGFQILDVFPGQHLSAEPTAGFDAVGVGDAVQLQVLAPGRGIIDNIDRFQLLGPGLLVPILG